MYIGFSQKYKGLYIHTITSMVCQILYLLVIQNFFYIVFDFKLIPHFTFLNLNSNKLRIKYSLVRYGTFCFF